MELVIDSLSDRDSSSEWVVSECSNSVSDSTSFEL